MHDAGPWPSAGMLLQISKRILVNFYERDVFARGRRIGRAGEPPVVGLELDGLERLEVGERQHDARGAHPYQ